MTELLKKSAFTGGVLLFLIMYCTTESPLPPLPQVKVYAFIDTLMMYTPQLSDSSYLRKKAVIRIGDTVRFLGFVVNKDERIKVIQWEMGDSTIIKDSVFTYAFLDGGIFDVSFSVIDFNDTYIKDSVRIYVNSIPDSVIISPGKNAANVSPTSKLSWQGIDKDAFDSILYYSVFVDNRTQKRMDTLLLLSTETSVSLPSETGYGDTLSWFVIAQDNGGEIVSSDTAIFYIKPEDSPHITSISPDSIIRCYGQETRLVVQASGVEFLNYTWIQNDSVIKSSLSCTLSIDSVTCLDSGAYTCIVSNAYGKDTSSPIHLNVLLPPTITLQAHNQTVCEGENVEFKVGAVGSGLIKYQWKKDGIEIFGETKPILRLPAVSVADNGVHFSCDIMNECNRVTSHDAVLKVVPLQQSPGTIVVAQSELCEGESTFLSISPSDQDSSTEWLWYTNDDTTQHVASGTVIKVSPSATTTYSIRGWGRCNTTDEINATVYVRSYPPSPKRIIISNDTICQDDSTTLSVIGDSLGYGSVWKWYYLDNILKDAGTGQMISVTPQKTTIYFVRSESRCSSSVLLPCTVFVDNKSVTPDSIGASQISICSNTSVQLSVKGGITGKDAQWKWYTDTLVSVPIDSGTTITVKPVQTTSYYVRAEGKCNSTAFVSKTISIKTVSRQPVSGSAFPDYIKEGDTSVLSIQGGILGTGAQWKWYTDTTAKAIDSGENIMVSPDSSRFYFVRAEGDCGTTPWSWVILHVLLKSEKPDSIGIENDTICLGTQLYLAVKGGRLGTDAKWQWFTDRCGGAPIGEGDTILVKPSVTTTYFVRGISKWDTSECANCTITVKTTPSVSIKYEITGSSYGYNSYRITMSGTKGATIYYRGNSSKWLKYSSPFSYTSSVQGGSCIAYEAYATLDGCNSPITQ